VRGDGCDAEGTRTRKVDSEVYTVRRDLINPPELLLEDGAPRSLPPHPLIRQDALCSPTTLCSRGWSKFQVMACSDREEGPFFPLSSAVDIALFIRIARPVKIVSR